MKIQRRGAEAQRTQRSFYCRSGFSRELCYNRKTVFAEIVVYLQLKPLPPEKSLRPLRLCVENINLRVLCELCGKQPMASIPNESL